MGQGLSLALMRKGVRVRRCRHRWEEIGRRFVQPIATWRELSGASEAFFRELTFGLTVIELRCQECGDVAERRLTGSAPVVRLVSEGDEEPTVEYYEDHS
jgi:hypothetical protein